RSRTGRPRLSSSIATAPPKLPVAPKISVVPFTRSSAPTVGGSEKGSRRLQSPRARLPWRGGGLLRGLGGAAAALGGWLGRTLGAGGLDAGGGPDARLATRRLRVAV